MLTDSDATAPKLSTGLGYLASRRKAVVFLGVSGDFASARHGITPRQPKPKIQMPSDATRR
jgi:hypothetical protein